MNTQSVSIRQLAVVVRDLDATVAAYHRIFGWGPWRILDVAKVPHRDTHVRGVPAAYDMRSAVTTVGDLDFEIIEPGAGPSPYREFLDTRGLGLHHIIC